MPFAFVAQMYTIIKTTGSSTQGAVSSLLEMKKTNSFLKTLK